MLRNILLTALAAASLAGCATDYAYRGGNGDYYYGQPRTEYRYYDPYGASGYGFGGYYYDRFGRPVYAYPYGYGGYYGGPYYGYPYWYRPRPHHDGDHRPPVQDGNDDGNDRKPPWRNLNGLVPRPRMDDGEVQRPRRQSAPRVQPMPQRPPAMPRMRSGDGGSRMGDVIRRAKVAPPEE